MKTLLFGAGQFGEGIFRLLDLEKYEVAGFLDNSKAGQSACGLPVYAVDSIPALRPELILLTVAGEARREEMRSQIAPVCEGLRIRVEAPPTDLVDIRGAEMAALAAQVIEDGTAGAVAELGVYKGDSAVVLNRLFPDRPLYLFDTFSGFDEADIREGIDGAAGSGDFSDTSAEAVLARLPFPQRAVIRAGRFPETAAGLECELFCFVSLDADLYEPVYQGLAFFYPRLSPGGMLLLHDARSARFPGAGQALRRFRQETGVTAVPLCDLHGSAIITTPTG
jgi:O-methyltransferase